MFNMIIYFAITHNADERKVSGYVLLLDPKYVAMAGLQGRGEAASAVQYVYSSTAEHPKHAPLVHIIFGCRTNEKQRLCVCVRSLACCWYKYNVDC